MFFRGGYPTSDHNSCGEDFTVTPATGVTDRKALANEPDDFCRRGSLR